MPPFSPRGRLDPVVVGCLQRIPARFEIKCAPRQPIGDLVGQGGVVLGIIRDERDAIVVDLRELRLELAVDGPEFRVFCLGELHHFGNDRDFLRAYIRAQQLGVGAQVHLACVVVGAAATFGAFGVCAAALCGAGAKRRQSRRWSSVESVESMT